VYYETCVERELQEQSVFSKTHIQFLKELILRNVTSFVILTIYILATDEMRVSCSRLDPDRCVVKISSWCIQ